MRDEDNAKRLHDLIFAPGSPGEEFTELRRKSSRAESILLVLAAIGFAISLVGLFIIATS